MPKKKKKRFDPNPELKNLPKTQAEVDRMFKEDDLLRRIDDAQAMLLKLQMSVGALEGKLKACEDECRILLADRDAAIRILGVVLAGQNVVP